MAVVKVRHQVTGGEWAVNEEALAHWQERGWQPVDKASRQASPRKQPAANPGGTTDNEE